jgi:riboflavin kinase/FMN adenylyltransferase
LIFILSNIGTKPTVSDELELFVKTHLFGYSGNAYGKNVKMEFLQLHREEIKFPNVAKLQQCAIRAK